MKPFLLFALGTLVLTAGCDSSSNEAVDSHPSSQNLIESTAQNATENESSEEPLMRTINGLRGSLSGVQSHLQKSSAQSWRKDAAAVQQTLLGIQPRIDRLENSKLDASGLTFWLVDLEGKLRNANEETWSRNTTEAAHLAGQALHELQRLSVRAEQLEQ